MAPPWGHHSLVALSSWKLFAERINPSGENAEVVLVDGKSLDIPTVVAIARYLPCFRDTGMTNAHMDSQRHGAYAAVNDKTLAKLNESRLALEDSLDKGMVIYGECPRMRTLVGRMADFLGVNTGFGGSADTRTDQVENLQSSLIRMLQYGVLVDPQPARVSANGVAGVNGVNGHHSPSSLTGILHRALPLEDPVAATCMPESWVRAAILIRINSLANGHSAVRPAVVERLLTLLEKDIVPRIPLQGSISASGDLSPLSYISGVIQGESNVTVWANDKNSGRRCIMTAHQALAQVEVTPIKLAAKEGLSIVNGTALSAALGSLAMHDAHALAVVSQILTAMSVEALCGTSESFDPFFAEVRPHPGQVGFFSAQFAESSLVLTVCRLSQLTTSLAS